MHGTPEEPDVGLLWKRNEGCIVYAGGTALSLQLTSVRSEWLGDIEAALAAAAERHRAPVPLVAVFRLDARYPLGVGFDANLSDLAATLRRLRKTLRAIAVVTEFDGLMATAMRLSVGVVSTGARSTLPISSHPSVPQALRWMALEVGESAVAVRPALAAARYMRELLGVG